MRIDRAIVALMTILVATPLMGAGVQDSSNEGNADTRAEVDAAAVTGVEVVFADISSEPVKIIRRLQPLADFVARELADEGVAGASVMVAPDMETLAEWLSAGQVHVYFDSLYPAMIASDLSGSRPVLRRWKDGVAEYRSVMFAHRENGVSDLADLVGHVIALEEPLSTSGFMLPLAYIKRAGYEPVYVENLTAPVPPGSIGYAFAGEDQNVLEWVMRGRVKAGFVDDGAIAELPEETRTEIEVLGESEPVARQVTVFGPAVDGALADSLVGLLTSLHENDEGREVLTALKNTNRIDEFPEGADAAFAEMRDVYRLVAGE